MSYRASLSARKEELESKGGETQMYSRGMQGSGTTSQELKQDFEVDATVDYKKTDRYVRILELMEMTRHGFGRWGLDRGGHWHSRVHRPDSSSPSLQYGIAVLGSLLTV